MAIIFLRRIKGWQQEKKRATPTILKDSIIPSGRDAAGWLGKPWPSQKSWKTTLELSNILSATIIKTSQHYLFNTTALMYAASKGNKEIVELLLSSGADVNATDGGGNTVLTAAKESQNSEIIMLIESNR
nr:ankyrin repeat domain-containing protein [Rufibacter sp. XAAS-G3-1]